MMERRGQQRFSVRHRPRSSVNGRNACTSPRAKYGAGSSNSPGGLQH